MKKTIIFSVLALAMQLIAQEKSTITVKKAEFASGVVIVSIVQESNEQQAKASFELHCNKGASGCTAPEPGSYLMVKLPKNWGMYDCTNVELYPSSADPATDQKIGQYCLLGK
jgi:hypothetical protein